METDADRTSTSRPFVVGSASQQGMRPHQEDAHVEVSNPLFSLVALFDGHGGPVAAKYCAKNLASALEQHMDIANDPKAWIEAAVARLENDVLEMCRASSESDGTTMVCAVVRGETLIVANVGDSEALLVGMGKGTGAPLSVVCMSEMHNPKKNSQESERCLALGASLNGGRLCHPMFSPNVLSIAVSRSIGDLVFKDKEFVKSAPVALVAKPHVVTHTLDKNTDWFVLLACDGVFDVISYKEAATIAAEFAEIPVKAAEAVVARALELGSSDNCSCSLLLL